MSPEEDSPDSPTLTHHTPGLTPSGALGSFGPYRVLQKIGEGGMGEVFLAEQTEPVRRRVAIKIIAAGHADRQVVARFEAERQAVAMMDHPAIAKVFDAGQTPAGVPYFVMEYIEGTRITEYCDAHHLTTRERVGLFIKVCEGVQHAHQKAVMHRDLKPSNVLVVALDGSATPKIIDFGLAKALGHRLTDRTMLTQVGAMVGTPDYMSPEQAETSGQDVDTRTDVYSLGVMLYELLAGALPFDPQELRRLSYTEMIRHIHEVEPPRPTARLGALGASAAAVARARRTDPATLQRALRGDLDWVVMKAMEKDRVRRYGSPAELAADLGRYLNDEPVSAGPPGRLYRARKFVTRHRFGVAAAAAAVVLLAGFGVAMAVQADRIAHERDRANEESKRAQRVSTFFEDLFLSADPSRAKGKDVTVREVMDAGRAKVSQELEGEPGVQVPLLRTLGMVYRNLGDFEPARELLEEAAMKSQAAFGPNARATLEARRHVAWLLQKQGKYEEARTAQQDVLERGRRVLGNDDDETLREMNDLAVTDLTVGRWQEAEALLEEAIDTRRRIFGDGQPATATVMNNLSRAYLNETRYQEAEALCREALEIQNRALGPDHVETLQTTRGLAQVLRSRGRYAEAEALDRETYETILRVLGGDHPDTLLVQRGLAADLLSQDKYREAEPLLRQVYEKLRQTRGETHGDTLDTLTSLARAIGSQGRHAEAEKLLRRILEQQQKAQSPDRRAAIATLEMLALEVDAQGRHQEAVGLLSAVADGRKQVLGPEHVATLQSLLNLAAVEADTGRLDEALTMTRDVLEKSRKNLGESHPLVGAALFNLGAIESRSGHKCEAVRYLVEARAAGEDLTALLDDDDKDYASLHGDPEFEALLKSVRDEAAKKP